MSNNRNQPQNQPNAADKPVEQPKSETFTYIGVGEEPPRKINFMGVQEFVRGKETPVTDPVVLAKLKGHPCFVKGAFSMEELHARDEAAAVKAGKQRKEDAVLNEAIKKKHRTE